MKKKILFLGNHAFVIYNFRKELIQTLLSNGYEVILSMPYDEDKVPILESWGCRFVETKVDRRGTNIFKDIKLFLFYLKLINTIKPDKVLTYTIKPNLYGGLSSRICKVPYITNITGLGSGFKKDGLLKKVLKILYKISLKSAQKVFLQNTSDQQIIKSLKVVSEDKMGLLPGSGVNLNEFEFIENHVNNTFKFIFVGRIMKDKGIYEYLEAAKKIYDSKEYKAEFLLVGFIESTEIELNQKIKNYHDKGIIRYLGYQKDVKPFISQSNSLIQPSHGGEGMSNVLLEAGAMGRVLLASNVPGCKEIINDKKNGFVFFSKNAVDLTEKIKKTLKLSENDLYKMSLESRKFVELNFNRQIVINEYMDVIEDFKNSKKGIANNA